MTEPMPAGPDDGMSTDPATAPEAAPGPDVQAQGGRRERRIAQDSAPAPAPRAAGTGSWLDHPATLVLLSLLALVAVVLGLDAATQGRPWALLPAALVVAAYVVLLRRRRSLRR